MIILENIYKNFSLNERGKQTIFAAIKPLSLHIKAGQIFGLMGYSGAGKSTLLRLINLLERPDGGRVIVDGQDLTCLSPKALRTARHNIGMIFQQFNLLSNQTVYQNIAFNLKICGYPSDKIDARVKECLDIVDLSDKIHHYPARLSGGQKQRVGIARALAPNPKVLLADEPTSALDPETTKSLLSCLQMINQSGITIVIVTHEMSVIRRICHQTALLHQGELLEIAQVDERGIHATTPIGKKLIED